MKDLIIGAADLYEWKHIKNWAKSIKDTGFSGDVVLIAYRVSTDLVENCKKIGIEVVHAMHDEFGIPIDYNSSTPTPVHRLRSFHIWQYLNECDKPYRYVAVTDTRDVVFQRDPSWYFEYILPTQIARLAPQDEIVVAPSENVSFSDEPWNRNMVERLFGPYIANTLQNCATCNSGTFFGTHAKMSAVLLQMFFMTKHAKTTGADQPALNVLAWSDCYSDEIAVLPMDCGWAAQLGTSMDPTKPDLIDANIEPNPTVKNGRVLTSHGEEYVIVHQYDRVPELRDIINKRYE